MNSSYNYENRPTNAQMLTQWNMQYALNHAVATIKAMWNSLSLVQKVVLVGIFAVAIYFVIKLIQQQWRWAAIASSQTEPVFLKDLEWDSGAKKIYIGNKKLPVIKGSSLPPDINNEYTYSFWIFMNNRNPFYPGADGASGPANMEQSEYKGKFNNLFYRGNGELTAGGDIMNQNLQTPGVWFGGQSNDALAIRFSTSDGFDEVIEIGDMPVNEWANVTFTFSGPSGSRSVVNVYLNGKLERSAQLKKNPRMAGKGFGLYVGHVGKGFPGEMAYLQYYGSALDSQKIQEIYQYYKRKIDEFMANFEYWQINGNTVPAVPTNLECIPSGVDDGEGEGDVDTDPDSAPQGGGGFLSGLKKDVAGVEKKFKTDMTADGNGSASEGWGVDLNGKMKSMGVQGDVSNMKKMFSGNDSEAKKKLDSWESEFSNYHL